jgi:hypothetical protein
MLHDPGPFFGQVKYVSGVNPHIMQFSLNNYVTPSFGHDFGTVDDRTSTPQDLLVAINAYVDVLKAFWSDGTTFVNFQLFSKPTPADIPVPIQGFALTTAVGTAGASFAEEATQQTINYRTTDFNLMKIVLLDYAENVSFSKILVIPGSGALFDLDDYLHSDGCVINGRDGNPAGTFISATKKLNDKLRKAYRQA